MGNSGDTSLIPAIEEYLSDGEPLVRAHAAWALWKLEGEGSKDTLLDHIKLENDPMVLEEIDALLRDIQG
jgi:epoxyqueuosine reductase